MQDYLGLGKGHRMNVPGTASGNWTWRMLSEEATTEIAEKLYRMTKIYGRLQK
jgi:4-alpha-glucanotransferase